MKTFSELSVDEKVALFRAWTEGHLIEARNGTFPEVWTHHPHPAWRGDCIYRVRPVPPSINWDHVAPGFDYLAFDEDGEAFLFTRKPEEGAGEWLSGDGICKYASHFASLVRGSKPWNRALISRQGIQDCTDCQTPCGACSTDNEGIGCKF